MATIYLAGPISDGDNPFRWHEDVQNRAPSEEWINPFLLHNCERREPYVQEIIDTDLNHVQQADAVLLRRIEDRNICGAAIEARHAQVHDVPVVIWNDAETDVPLFLAGHAHSVHQDLHDAIAEVVQMGE